jgi:cell division cycle 20-like protein 1 (cofactor of APC complex)
MLNEIVSPSKFSPSKAEDRFIPSRTSVAFARKALFTQPVKQKEDEDNISELPKEEVQLYDAAIQNETLQETNTSIPMFKHNSPLQLSLPSPEKSVLRYSYQKERYSPYHIPSTSPISEASKKLLVSPRRVARKIPKLPYRILDAPELQDDFYLNMLDWSSQNVLAVGLGASVYMWNAGSGQVFKLCDLSSQGDLITSVAWSDRVSLPFYYPQCGDLCYPRTHTYVHMLPMGSVVDVDTFHVEL